MRTKQRELADSSVDLERLDSHPLLAGKCFYMLPVRLFASVVHLVGKRRFDPDAVDLEEKIAGQCSENSAAVGRWRRSWVEYGLLRTPSRRDQNVEISQRDTSTLPRPFAINHLYSARGHRQAFQSYLGWLLTNKQFLDEHDTLFLSHAETIRRWGMGNQEPGAYMFKKDADNPNLDPNWAPFRDQRDRFYFRWRLSGMVGPYLAFPVGSQPNAPLPVTYFLGNEQQSGLYLLPDITPVPSRDELRRAIDESRRRAPVPEHLTEWLRMIRSGNKAKNQLTRYGRVFELHHYWRVLHARHRQALRSNIERLDAVFADWFDVSEETIHQDRRLIGRRLGRGWAERAWPV